MNCDKAEILIFAKENRGVRFRHIAYAYLSVSNAVYLAHENSLYLFCKVPYFVFPFQISAESTYFSRSLQ